MASGRRLATIPEEKKEDLASSEDYMLDSLKDSVMFETFVNPIITADGHTHEKDHLFHHWAVRLAHYYQLIEEGEIDEAVEYPIYTSPPTGQRLPNPDFLTNHVVKKIRDEYVTEIVPKLQRAELLEKLYAKQAQEMKQLRDEREELLHERAHLQNENGQLLNQVARLQNEKGQLLNQVARLQNENGQLLNQVARLQNERAQILEDLVRIRETILVRPKSNEKFKHQRALDNRLAQARKPSATSNLNRPRFNKPMYGGFFSMPRQNLLVQAGSLLGSRPLSRSRQR